ncbi:PucR family transcriptional regulator [Arthrobacter sp. AB6]|uniref:PucR family transcriptional regulator n=1 Tax=Arthrobacter sp. AB6 TaxID=2962570 RepID=UPI0028811541|nr:PucR family transcriptional regulator [Arthrobacter sp. AB6]MDT0196517.1 PucR family transcriptional regulator [Arthrobacter sp. AB6]
MAVTVADLLNQKGLSLRCVAGHKALANVVRWVHVSEVDDPTPWLLGGEMLITTNLYGREESTLVGYFDSLKKSGVAAVGYGTGWPGKEVPAAWRTAAAAAGLPLLEVPFETPYIALSEFVAARLAEERARDFETTLAGQADLAASLLKGVGESDILDRLAGQLHGWAGILDARGRVIKETVQAPAGMSAILDAMPGRVGLSPLSASTVAVPGVEAMLIPLGEGPSPRLLVMGRAKRFDPLERIFISTAASLLALSASQRTQVSVAERKARTLIAQTHGYGGLLDLYEFPADASIDVALLLATNPLSHSERLALEQHVAAYAERYTSVSTQLDELLIFAQPLATESADAIPWARLHQVTPSATLGVCRDVRTGDVEAGVWNATTAAHRAKTSGSGVMEYAMLGSQDRLVSMFGAETRTEFSAFTQQIRTQLDPETLEAVTRFLAHNGSLEAAASDLGIHRQTLRTRLQRAERRAGFSLASPDDRSVLWLALRD